MKIGVVITMYNEHNTVLKSIECIKNSMYESYVVVVHSNDNVDSEALKIIKNKADSYYCLPNLAETLPRYQIPANSLCRNFSLGFSDLYIKSFVCDVIAALTGDTLVTDVSSFERRFLDMVDGNKIAFISQAIGQVFHADTDNVEKGFELSRPQLEDTTDFMPQLFFLHGEIATRMGLFSDIKLTNKYTSEQCIGDELFKHFKDNFYEVVAVLNKDNVHYAYQYNDGVKLQYEG